MRSAHMKLERELNKLPITFIRAVEEVLKGERELKKMGTWGKKSGNHPIIEDVDKGEEKIMEPRMMTVQEVADCLRISRFSVYNLVKRGELSAMKVLNKFRFSPDSVEQYLNNQRINEE